MNSERQVPQCLFRPVPIEIARDHGINTPSLGPRPHVLHLLVVGHVNLVCPHGCLVRHLEQWALARS
ncbi:MAG: hypothetical protein AB1486_16730 [Planctomycetota bacterium]